MRYCYKGRSTRSESTCLILSVPSLMIRIITVRGDNDVCHNMQPPKTQLFS